MLRTSGKVSFYPEGQSADTLIPGRAWILSAARASAVAKGAEPPPGVGAHLGRFLSAFEQCPGFRSPPFCLLPGGFQQPRQAGEVAWHGVPKLCPGWELQGAVQRLPTPQQRWCLLLQLTALRVLKASLKVWVQ